MIYKTFPELLNNHLLPYIVGICWKGLKKTIFENLTSKIIPNFLKYPQAFENDKTKSFYLLVKI
jgi:hypothetical protein